jgi:hypothetical protein
MVVTRCRFRSLARAAENPMTCPGHWRARRRAARGARRISSSRPRANRAPLGPWKRSRSPGTLSLPERRRPRESLRSRPRRHSARSRSQRSSNHRRLRRPPDRLESKSRLLPNLPPAKPTTSTKTTIPPGRTRPGPGRYPFRLRARLNLLRLRPEGSPRPCRASRTSRVCPDSRTYRPDLDG